MYYLFTMTNITAAALSLSRHEFIAAWLIDMTRRKVGRSYCGGLQVKRTRVGFSVSLNGIAFVAAKDAASLFEFARRSALGYYVREAERLRIEAYASAEKVAEAA